MYRIGIDLGGTNIKSVILDEDRKALVTDSSPTPVDRGFEAVMEAIAASIRRIQERSGITKEISGGGLTIPGQICGPTGPVLYAPNLGWHNADPVGWLKEHCGLSFLMGNDADCFALAEAVLGAGADYPSILMLALGTGVGGAFILHRRIFDGFGAFGGEFGHIPLVHGGHPCPCGINGCFEQYCSANGLARLGREMLTGGNPEAADSLLWKMCNNDPEQLTTIHLFEAARLGDAAASKVLDFFLDCLAEGITGLVNIFRPGAVIISGGLSEAGDALFGPVNERVSRMTYGSSYLAAPPILKASGGVYSGAVGAALLQDD